MRANARASYCVWKDGASVREFGAFFTHFFLCETTRNPLIFRQIRANETKDADANAGTSTGTDADAGTDGDADPDEDERGDGSGEGVYERTDLKDVRISVHGPTK